VRVAYTLHVERVHACRGKSSKNLTSLPPLACRYSKQVYKALEKPKLKAGSQPSLLVQVRAMAVKFDSDAVALHA
jgi:hypothetical protein